MPTLSNNEIEAAIEAGQLILNADAEMVEAASYQLRMGNVYYDLSEDAKRIQLKPGQRVLIKPGHRVVLITAERLLIPDDIIVRVISKGALFSIGLSPVATYADPGFQGNLGLVTMNIGDKYIELPPGEPIAKAEFSKLLSPSTKPYVGQHGFQAGIWPLKDHLQKEYNEVKGDERVSVEKEEAFALLPQATRTVIRDLEFFRICTIIGLGVAIAINATALFLAGTGLMSNFSAVLVNLISTVLISLFLTLVNRIKEK
ncbi:dCTP deaminase domain-containing protein [Martelella endophytica]|uniref:dUTPase-like domain-containing protein n=1 Tax=Martelella endophytica TaxID=1486262 RepID=A0A0D5LRT4_MAREN|nr:hypothetical protein [Martelella endophytica]AJY46472.1 hypothetical protein TM49_13550 [Martelella endophytica]